MSTTSQVLANQRNAQASTGPRTPEGKAISSRNALKFGLTSKQILLPWENPADFEALHAAIAEQFQPATDAESMLVDNIAVAEWRERRTEIAQTAWLEAQTKDIADSHKAVATAMYLASHQVEKFQKYAAAYRRERNRAWSKLEAMQKARRAEAERQAEAAATAKAAVSQNTGADRLRFGQAAASPAPQAAQTSGPAPGARSTGQ
jgi:hypothetical protein